jgi:hypothetical protein
MDNLRINQLKQLLNAAVEQCNDIAQNLDTSEGGMGHGAMIAAKGQIAELVEQLNALGIVVNVTTRDPYTLMVTYQPASVH